jgi:peptidoglycan/LPS O-acetylase OafA/YrhL
VSTAAAPRRAAEVTQAGEVRLSRIESLRALAAMGVVIGHAWGIAHAFGPDAHDTYLKRTVYGASHGAFLLLGLSGYLLFWPFVRHHWGGRAPVDLRQYALNRALRIVPLYVIAMVFLLIVQEEGGTIEQWLTVLTLSQNFTHEWLFTVDGPLWTIVVEVHFYFALPVIAWVLSRGARDSANRAAALLALIALPSLGVWLWAVTFSTGPTHRVLWQHSFPGTFFFIAAGMLLAFLRLKIERARPAWMDGPLGASDLWLGVSAVIWLILFSDFDLLPFVTVATFLTVGACVLPLRPGRLVRVLDWKPLAVVGVASYSLYVWHLPLEDFITGYSPGDATGVLKPFVLAIPVCIAVALLSYRLIEEPFLRLRKRWSPASAPQAPS